jgi:hypothetical protein
MKFYDSIYLSPHLDDAVFSCCGHICHEVEKGRYVLIVTLMAGIPEDRMFSEFQTELHKKWNLTHRAVPQRRIEDEKVCKRIGADCLHADFADCIYRLSLHDNTPLYPNRSAVFESRNIFFERYLLDNLAGFINKLPKCDNLYLPLAIGNHIDHRLTTQAGRNAKICNNIFYYEDYPYVEYCEKPELSHNSLMTKKVTSLNKEILKTRVGLMSEYKSQISVLFGGYENLKKRVSDFYSVHNEVYWQKA